MAKSITRRSFVLAAASTVVLVGTACASPQSGGTATDSHVSSVSSSERVTDAIAAMTLEQKIAQMIMPALRTWEGKDKDVTDLSALPDLASALQKYQFGGVALFASNVVDTAQTLRLVSDLQANNAKGAVASSTTVVPYFVAADQEGGSVARLSMGTRGTGSMAVGATGDAAAQNAGDGSDNPTAVSLTPEQLQKGGLKPYAAVVDNGAAMVMVSVHLPQRRRRGHVGRRQDQRLLSRDHFAKDRGQDAS